MHKRLLIILISAFLFGGCNRLENHQPRTNLKFPLTGVSTIAQSFTASHDNLNIVSLCLRNSKRSIGSMQFNLYEATSSSQALRSINFDAGNIDNQDCTRFQFEPVAESKDKNYLAEVSISDPAITLGMYVEGYTDDDYPQGTAISNEAPQMFDLHFKTFYKQDLKSIVTVESYNFVSRLFKDKLFFTIYAILVLAILYKIQKLKS